MTVQRTSLTGAVVLFILSFFYLLLCMDRTVGPYDESITLFGAVRVMAGEIPHRDFYAPYGPSPFYTLAALFRVFGASVLIERIWTLVFSSAIVAVTFMLVETVAPRRNAFLAAIANLLWLQTTKEYATAVIPAAAFMLTSLLILLPCLFGRVSPGRHFAAGLCAGIVALCRYDMGAATFGAESLLLAVATLRIPDNRHKPIRAIAHAILIFASGFGLIVVSVAIAFIVYGVIPDLVFDVIQYQARAYARTRSLPLPRLWGLRKDPFEFIGVYLPLALCAAALVALIRSWRPASRRTWATAGLTLLVSIGYIKGFVRVSVSQMMTALIFSMPLAAILPQPIPGRDMIRRILTGIIVLIGAVTITTTIPQAVRQAERNVAWARDPRAWQLTDASPIAGSCRMPPGLERMACFPVSPEDAATIRYVQQQTGPDEPVFIGLSRHDKIFVNDIQLYFAIGHRSATKWHNYEPGLQTSVPIQTEMVTELQRQKPKLVVLVNQWTDIREPNDSAISSGVTLLDDYIARTYVPVATFGVNTILRIKPNQSDAG